MGHKSDKTSRLERYRIGAQLIQFAENQKANPQTVLGVCANLGIRFIEVNLCELPDIAQLASACDKHEVRVGGLHVRFEEISSDDRLEMVSNALSGLSCPRLICSGLAEGAQAVTISRTARRFREVIDWCNRRQVTFFFHPYEQCISENEVPNQLEMLMTEMNDPRIKLVIDTFWCASLLRFDATRRARLLDMCNYFHIKDGFRSPGLNQPMFTPLGEGEMLIETWLYLIKKAAQRASVVEIVIEQDACATDPADELGRSIKYLAARGM